MARPELLDDLLSSHLLIGAVKWRSRWRYFAGTLGEWTLDYRAYDPSYTPPAGDKSFRGGLMCVDQSNADEFCAVMEPWELAPGEIADWVKHHGSESVPLVMVVDFDERLFVHGYSESVEPKSTYLPKGWQGIEDDPYKHVPSQVAAPWC